MLSLYDHIVAVLVGGVIILLLFNVQQRTQQTTVEQTMMYMAKTSTLDLASFLERDLENAGYDTPAAEQGILQHNTNGDGITDTLVFWGVGSAGTRTRIAYGVSAVDSTTIDGVDMAVYELRRYERQGSDFVRAGGSPKTLTDFEITLLTSGSTPTTDLATVAKLELRLANTVLPDLEDGTYLQGYRRLHWGITLSPPGLQ